MIQAEKLCKSFGGAPAVTDLSLEIRQGEVFGFLGPNGAGKTTTVSMMVGLLKPDSGTVRIQGGGSPLVAEWRAKIGLAPQSIALYNELTGRENLTFFGKLQGLSGRHLKERVAWALDFVGLMERSKDRTGTYSGGMQRRLNLAAALLHDPPILLLDEPTAGVDPQSRNALFENIRVLKQEGRTVVYTTHYMEEAERLCDRVGIIDHGKLLALDTVDGLLQTHGGPQFLVAEFIHGEERIKTDQPLDRLMELKKRGDLMSFRMERPNLEQVFLNLTGRQLRD
ncbi:MAG: ABC transporter ATP-binding protein [Planctomycetes bacterium]|nr:ABC transporter ATP-binding protein [Planctomycetota bacterium]